MTRTVTALCAVSALGLGLTVYGLLGSSANDPIARPAGRIAPLPPLSPQQAALQQARRACDLPALDEVIAELRRAVAATPTDGPAWHALADALLERALARNHLRGVVVGEPLHATLPVDLAADLDSGLDAVRRARGLGDDSGDLYRIEASLMT
jgi:hypothetical protein